jgi:glycosyltransferase involved in cell wall biosynthesis
LLKVLFVSPNGYLGGAEKFVLTASYGHFKRQKIDVGILFFSAGEASKEAQHKGIECFVLKNKFRLSSPIKLLVALFEIRKTIKAFKPDVLHLTMPYSHIVISLATIGLGIPKVWFQHGPVGGTLDKIANIFPVDMIWYNSADLQKRHQQTKPLANVKIKEAIIHLGVEKSNKEHTIFQNQLIKLGAAGRLCSWKGFHIVIQALGELRQEHNLKSYKFFIAGSAKTIHDQQYAEELLSLTETLHLREQVSFLGHVKDMSSFYQNIDIFIHSSTIPEPFGLVVAEAMINGCLVIASDKGGVTELIQNERTGLTFPSTEKNALAEIKKLLSTILVIEDKRGIDHLLEIAANGKKFVETHYSIDKMINEMENLYLQCMQSKKLQSGK